jgi:hypothetical protein
MKRSTRLVALLCTALSTVILAADPPFVQKIQAPKSKPVDIDPATKPKCATDPDSEFAMVVPLGHLRFFRDGSLMLNNRGNESRSVVPYWYVEDGGLVEGPSVLLPASRMGFYPIADFIPPTVDVKHITGLELRYVAKSREVWAQAIIKPTKDAGIAQSVDSPFGMTTDFRSSVLEAVFPSDVGPGRLIVTVVNTSDREAQLAIEGINGVKGITVAARSGRVIDRPLSQSQSLTGSVRLISDGSRGAIRANAVVVSKDSRPLLIRFFDPGAAVGEDLYAAGVTVAQRTLQVALSNTSDAVVDASPQLLDPATGAILEMLPTVTLKPHSNAILRPDVSQLPAGTGVVMVKIDGNGAPGSLVGALHTTRIDTGLTSEVPLRDVGGVRASTGGYPWRLDGDYQTRIHISNVGQIAARFSARLQFGQTTYVMRTDVVPVGATVTYNIRELRDRQVPDAYGNVIPLGQVSGQFYWSAYRQQPGVHFSGRAEMVSEQDKTSSSFSCMMCCPESLLDGYLAAAGYLIEEGVSTSLFPERRMMDCYESVYWEPVYVDYFAYNGSVLSVDGDSPNDYAATGQGEGTSGLLAAISGDHWVLVQPEYAEENDHCDATPALAQPQIQIQVVLYDTCPRPKEFQHVGYWADDPVPAAMTFQYEWESTTGHKSDLFNDINKCWVGEVVGYPGSEDPWPWPYPFPAVASPNLTKRFIPANSDAGGDTQWPGSPQNQGFRGPPWDDASFLASQAYKWGCTCKGFVGPNNLQLTPFSGFESILIQRRVFELGGAHYYSVSKSGYYLQMQLDGPESLRAQRPLASQRVLLPTVHTR